MVQEEYMQRPSPPVQAEQDEDYSEESDMASVDELADRGWNIQVVGGEG